MILFIGQDNRMKLGKDGQKMIFCLSFLSIDELLRFYKIYIGCFREIKSLVMK